jgi:hypothetical protein
MSDLQTVESLIRISIEGPPDGDQSSFDSALQFAQQLCESWDGFVACVGQFSEFALPTSKKFALILCKQWCLRRWEMITAEVQAALGRLLFESSIAEFGDLPPDFRNLLGDAQCAFVWNAYPSSWPSFWADLLGTDPLFVLNFLDGFCSFTSQLPTDDNATFALIKQSMRSSMVDKQLVEFIGQFLVAGGSLGFRILASLAEWVSLDQIMSAEMISLIATALDDPETAASSYNVLTALLNRGMERSTKMELIESLELPPRIIRMICTHYDCYSMALLVETLGGLLIDDEISTSYFQISLQLLTNSGHDISGCVAPFIQRYTKLHPDVSSIVLNTSYSRLKDYYEDLAGDDPSFCELLFDVIRICFQVNFDSSIQFLRTICESIEIAEELPHGIAILEILSDQHAGPDFVEFFEPLLGVEHLDGETHFKVMASYLRFFSSVAENFDPPVVSEFFMRMSTFAIGVAGSSLAKSLASFAKRHRERIIVDPSIVVTFAGSDDPNLTATAGILLASLHESQFDTFQACFELLESKSDAGASLLLRFVKMIPCVADSPIVPLIKAALTRLDCTGSDDLLSLFIRSVFVSLRSDGLEIISKCIDNAIGPLSIGSLCKIVGAMQNHEVGKQVATALLPRVQSVVRELGDVTIANDGVIAVSEMLRSWLNLILLCLDEFDEDISSFLADVRSIFDENSTSPEFLIVLMRFLGRFVRMASAAAFGIFGQFSFVVVLRNRFFDSRKPRWSQVAIRLARFHSRLFAADADRTALMVASVLAELGAAPEMITCYLALLTTASPPWKEDTLEFYAELKRQTKALE